MAKRLQSSVKMIHKFTVMEAIIGAKPACGNCKYHHGKRIYSGKREKIFEPHFCRRYHYKPKHYYRLVVSDNPNSHPDEKYFLSTWKSSREQFNWPSDRMNWVCFKWEPIA